MTATDPRRMRDEAISRILAAHWSGVNPENDAALRAWRQCGPAYEAAFQEAREVWDSAAELRHHREYADLMGVPTLRERCVLACERLAEWLAEWLAPVPRPAWAAMAALSILFASTMISLDSSRSDTPQYATRTAEMREVPLEDGSLVTLGARSKLAVKFSVTVRHVQLGQGEAFFSVAKNTARPFVVEAGDTLIRVVGTRFNVNYSGERVRVTVLEGVVDLMRKDGSVERIAADLTIPKVRLLAGQQAIDSTNLPMPHLEEARAVQPGGWRAGRFSYQDAPLAEIVADANRYRKGEIRIASTVLANERVTTSFTVAQVDQMLDTLADALPVQVQHNPDGSVDLLARSGG